MEELIFMIQEFGNSDDKSYLAPLFHRRTTKNTDGSPAVLEICPALSFPCTLSLNCWLKILQYAKITILHPSEEKLRRSLLWTRSLDYYKKVVLCVKGGNTVICLPYVEDYKYEAEISQNKIISEDSDLVPNIADDHSEEYSLRKKMRK
jgi:hypothetical protein